MNRGDERDRHAHSPWGIASGAEDSGKYPGFLPLLRDAGATWLRYFAEWGAIQPTPDAWNWDWSDRFVAAARAQGVRIAGTLLYFAPWASSDSSSRGFPVRDIAAWRAYVKAAVSRYKGVITHWEVWNEGNSPAFNRHGTPRDYADLVREAYAGAKEADPDCRIGITCAAFDLHYLAQVIAAGASGCFDYVCVHPYNCVGHVFGGETTFLALAGDLRAMLAASGQRADLPLWISEIGLTTTRDPAALARQAEGLVKAFVLGIAQGFERVCWFEACGPKYGDGVHAILDDDLTPFPSYHALAAMTRALGAAPRFVGWAGLGDRCCGFVFEDRDVDGGPRHAMALWSDAPDAVVRFDAAVEVVDLRGRVETLPPAIPREVAAEPVFVHGLPRGVVDDARANAGRRFPWAPDWRDAAEVWCKLGPANEEHGLRQGDNDPRDDGRSVPGVYRGRGYRSTDLRNRRPFLYLNVDPTYMGWGDRDAEVAVVARRAVPDQPACLTLVYESETGYHEYGKRTTTPGLNTELLYESEAHRAPEVWYLDPTADWQAHTWRIPDACLVRKWGWTLQLNAEMSAGDVWVAEVRVRRVPGSPAECRRGDA